MISAPRVESTTSPCSAPASRELAQPAIPSPSTKHPVFQPGTHKSCYACKARKVKCPNADYPKPCGNCLRRKETCCFGKKTVPRRNVTKHLHFTRPLKGTEKCTSVSSNTLFYVDQPLVPAQDEKSSQTETSTLPNQPSVFSETASIPASANACATSTSIIPRLYLDHVLDQAYINCYKKAGDNGSHDAGPANGHVPSGKANGIFGSSYRLTYFTESRLASLSGRLRNHKVDDLVHRINSHIWQRLRRPTDAPNVFDTPDAPDAQDVPNKSPFSSSNPIHVEPELEAAYIQIYFERAHPLCPFLDRTAFEARALRENDASRTTKEIKENAPKKAWSVLYYSVLAIGCAYMDSSTSTTANANARPSSRHCFEPGKSTAWRLFAQGALAHFADLHILPEDSLLTLQALTAMSVYGLGVACLSIERVILTEAARRAQSMAQIPSAQSSVSFQRTFWILYGIEKVTSFHFGRSSMFVDSDIACPFPASFGGDGTHATWPILWILHARLLSRTYASLFSVGTACNTAAHSLATIDQLHKEVEAWRLSVPEARGLRPDASSRAPGLHSHDPTERIMTLGHRYMYHSLVLILSHAQLHHFSQLPPSQKAELATVAAQKKAQDTLIVAARTILELTSLIEVEPHTPLWLLAVVPLMALLVLFDVVVHSSPSTLSSSGSDIALNLVLLDMGAGYFSRIEYASGGSLPGSLLSEFAHIARDYVNDYQRRVREQERSDKTVKSTAKSTTSVLISAQQLQQPLPSPPAPTLPHTALLPQATDIPPQPFGTMNTTSSTWSLSSAVLPVVADVGSTTSTSSKEAYVRPSSLELLTTSDMHPFSNGVVFPDGNSGPSSRDGSVYGVNTGYWNENGSNGVDLTGTDVMGLFTSNYYFLPEMDGILYDKHPAQEFQSHVELIRLQVTILSNKSSSSPLTELDVRLGQHNVARRIVLDNATHADEMTRPPADGQGWVKTEEAKLRLRRIPFLANLRNKVLEPLQDQQKRGVTYDHILFLEDVLFHANDVQAFISTNQGNYVAACAVDVSKTPILYDTFALRDSDGHAPLMLRWPWFRSKTSREAALRGVPIPVQSCWNGMVAIRTEPFYPKNGQHFRGLPDSLASYHLEESKCCLIHADNAAMALPAPKNGGGVR